MGMPGVSFIPNPQQEQKSPSDRFKQLYDFAMAQEKSRDEEALKTIHMFEYAMSKDMPIAPKMMKNFEKAMARLGMPIPRSKDEWEGARVALASKGTGSVTPNQAASMGGSMQGDVGGAQAGAEVSKPARSQAPEGGLTGQPVATQALQSIVGSGAGVVNPAEQRDITHSPTTGVTEMTGGGPPTAPVQQTPEAISALQGSPQQVPGFELPEWVRNQQLANRMRQIADLEQVNRDTIADRLVQRLANGDTTLSSQQIGMAMARLGQPITEPAVGMMGMDRREFGQLKDLHLGAEPPSAKAARQSTVQLNLIEGGFLNSLVANHADIPAAAKAISEGRDPRLDGIAVRPDIRRSLLMADLSLRYAELGIPWVDAQAMALVQSHGGDPSNLYPATFKTAFQQQMETSAAQREAILAGIDMDQKRYLLDVQQFRMQQQQLELALGQALVDAQTEDQKEALDRFTVIFDQLSSSKDSDARKMIIESGAMNQALRDLSTSLGWSVSQKDGLLRGIRNWTNKYEMLKVERPGADWPSSVTKPTTPPSVVGTSLQTLGRSGMLPAGGITAGIGDMLVGE